MKKYHLLILSFISMSLLAKPSSGLDKLLKAVEMEYKNKSYTIEFDYSFKPAESKASIQKASFQYSSEFYKLLMNDQAIYFDGETQWTYFIDRKEVQITNSTLEESAFHPLKFAKLYSTNEFKYKINSDQGQFTDVEFVPNQKDKEYVRIILKINKQTKQIAKIDVQLKNGDKYQIFIKKHNPLKSIKKEDFQMEVSKYPGIHIEDLR